MSKQRNASAVILLTLSALAGCANRPQAAENRRDSTVSPARQAASADKPSRSELAEQRRQEIDELISEATAGPSAARRSAAALAATDRSTADLADLLNAIDAARRTILSNLRNADTTGFKATQSKVEGHQAVCRLDLTQGELDQTTSSLDLAIQGNGFFAIKLVSALGDGIGYTRAGNFCLNAKGELILSLGEGYHLVPPIKMPTGCSNIVIGEDGTVQATPFNSNTPRTIAHLQLAQFVNPGGMQTTDSSVLLATDESGQPTTGTPGTNGMGTIEQGFLEASNVDLIRERLRLRFLNEWQNAIEQGLAAADRPKHDQPVR